MCFRASDQGRPITLNHRNRSLKGEGITEEDEIAALRFADLYFSWFVPWHGSLIAIRQQRPIAHLLAIVAMTEKTYRGWKPLLQGM